MGFFGGGGGGSSYVPPPDNSALIAQQTTAANQAADATKNRLRASGGLYSLNGPNGYVGATGNQTNQTLGGTN